MNRYRYVYAITNKKKSERQFVKFGISSNPAFRITAIQSGSPWHLVVAAQIPGCNISDESAIHRHFAKERAEGEWFRYVDEVRELVTALEKDPTRDTLAYHVPSVLIPRPDVSACLNVSFIAAGRGIQCFERELGPLDLPMIEVRKREKAYSRDTQHDHSVFPPPIDTD